MIRDKFTLLVQRRLWNCEIFQDRLISPYMNVGLANWYSEGSQLIHESSNILAALLHHWGPIRVNYETA